MVDSMWRYRTLLLSLAVLLSLTGVGAAQTVTPTEVVTVDWKMILATLINGTLVLAVVSIINAYKPTFREKYPWAVPLLATLLGPALGAVQTYILAKFGIQVDFNPIIAALAGAAATTAHQVGTNLPEPLKQKVRFKRPA